MKYSQTTQSFGIFHTASSLKFVLLCTLQRVYHKNVFNAKEKAYIFIFLSIILAVSSRSCYHLVTRNDFSTFKGMEVW